MNISIRNAIPEDAEAVVHILNAIIETGLYTAFDTPLTVEQERAYILNFPARGIFHVATCEPDARILGFQSMEPFAMYTRAFDHVGVLGTYIDLSYRRKGVSSLLFDATFTAAREKGYEKIFTYVREDNPAALAAYLKQGFRIVGIAEKHARINGVFVNEIIIEKIL